MITPEEQQLAAILVAATTPTVHYSNGRVVGVVDGTGRVTVDLGDQSVTAVVPGNLADVVGDGLDVRLQIQDSTIIIDSVLSPIPPDEQSWWDAHPPGFTAVWWTATPPSGWWLMQGQSISSSLYPRCYAIFGSSLPDARDRFLLGASSSRAVKTVGGSATIAVSQIPGHDHTTPAHTHPLTSALSYAGSIYRGVDPGTGVFSGDSGSAISATGSGGGGTSGSTGGGQEYWGRYVAGNLIVRMG